VHVLVVDDDAGPEQPNFSGETKKPHQSREERWGANAVTLPAPCLTRSRTFAPLTVASGRLAFDPWAVIPLPP
jgi:hypothetical protein